MSRPALALLCAGLAVAAGAVPASAQMPVRTEDLVYSILAYNGRDFTPTFARQESDAIYLIAGADNILSLHKTLIYFWPLTGEWKTDPSGLDIPFNGVLEITDRRGKTIRILPSRYTYYNERGEYELNWKVARDEQADAVWAHWQQLTDAYGKALVDYQKALARVQDERVTLTARIMRMRREGRDPAALVDRLSSLRDPVEPAAPQEYAVPPAQIRKAFIVNLPPGVYAMRFRDPDGKIMEGSDKRLVVHRKEGPAGTGYEVIPGDKWTRPVQSMTPSSVIYVDGSTDLYLRPFFEERYNDLFYEKTINNDGRGNASLLEWKRIQQVPHAGIEVLQRGAAASVVTEKPWYVEQGQGSALGYRIVPYDPQGAHRGKEPSLIAFRFPLDRARRIMRLDTVDVKGAFLPGSRREIRVIGTPRAQGLLPILAALPLIAMVIVLLMRARTYRGSGQAQEGPRRRGME